MMLTIETINQMTQTEFIAQFGCIFEDTPTIAEQAWTARPFQNLNDLHQKMVEVVAKSMTAKEQLSLICAHPELGKRGKMAAASVQEQTSAGLSQLNTEDYSRIQALNAAYREKFGFPFVVAVKGLSVTDVVAAMEKRMQTDKSKEMARSLTEIYKIARFRLADIVQ
ncbi:MAG: 2-oxo-4-hydroxy-4-carboxy-5-ureidoimidazoline decarboxylase [Phormidesmis sp.]